AFASAAIAAVTSAADNGSRGWRGEEAAAESGACMLPAFPAARIAAAHATKIAEAFTRRSRVPMSVISPSATYPRVCQVGVADSAARHGRANRGGKSHVLP